MNPKYLPISDRIKELAKPFVKEGNIEDAFVKRKVNTERINELATPKHIIQPEVEPGPETTKR